MRAQVLQAAFLISTAEIQLQQERHAACHTTLSAADQLLQQSAHTDAQRLTAARAQLTRGRLLCACGDATAGLASLAAAQSLAESSMQQLQAGDALDHARCVLAQAAVSLGEQSLQQNSLDAAWHLSAQAKAHLSRASVSRLASPGAASILLLQQAVLQAAAGDAADTAAEPTGRQLLLQRSCAQTSTAMASRRQAPSRAKGSKPAASRHEAAADSGLPAGQLAQQARWRLLTQGAKTFRSMPVIARQVCGAPAQHACSAQAQHRQPWSTAKHRAACSLALWAPAHNKADNLHLGLSAD